jgi:Na+/glutamate symporter
MARTILATALNFFFPGAGYLVLGHKVLMSIAWLVGVIGLTYVELGIQTAAPQYYWPMFISVLVMNTAFAADAFRVGRAKQQQAVGGVARAA